MAKRGSPKHVKRIAVPKSAKISDKKDKTWYPRSAPGPHSKETSMPLLVFVRDVLGYAATSREAKIIISSGEVAVDRRIRKDPRFPVGLMDVLSFPKIGKYYRVMVDWKGRLYPIEIKEEEANKKLLKVVKKHTIKGNRINLTLHDGRNIIADNNIKVGDTIELELPKDPKSKPKLSQHLKLENGSTCLITEGKHTGSIVKLKDIIKRAGGKAEAMVERISSGRKGAAAEEEQKEFVTVANYLFVVGDSFKL